MAQQPLSSTRPFSVGISAGVFSTICAIVVLFPVSAASSQSEEFRPGCAPDHPAVVHQPGGIPVDDATHEEVLIPCSNNTGSRSSEIALVVTNAGTLLLMPAVPATGFPIGVTRSTDDGVSWNFVLPSNVNNPPRVTPVDNNMHVDRQTGRIFWIVGTPGGTTQIPRLDISDDDGRTWRSSTSSQTIRPIDHSQIFTGPPPKSLAGQMGSYPNVVYLCQSSHPQICQYSLDGGMSFSAGVALPVPPEAGTTGTNFALKGVVAEDGTLYVPSTPCERPYVGISHDAGHTWKQVLVATDTETMGFGELSLGIDDRGNLYATWVAVSDRLPYLAVSRDRGLTWGQPIMIASPGINEAALPQLVAGKRGHVAIAYYGSTNSPGAPFPPTCVGQPPVTASPLSTSCPAYQAETWNTYITETWNGLDDSPLFWSAPLNDPAIPTWYGCSPSALGVGGEPEAESNVGCLGSSQSGAPYWGRMDYFSITMDEDGVAWAGFNQECPNGLPYPPEAPSNCGNATGAAQDSLWGMVGRLIHVRMNRKYDE